MCGIAGIFAPSGFDPENLIAMTHLVKHRGPDGFGLAYFGLQPDSRAQCFHDEDGHPEFERPRLGFGARRLAILDLSELGNQPMQIEDGQLWITYNGEIYNYIEIRKELEALGHRFRTGTDTEVILRAYDQWGSSCVNRFNGMWSFAIYDRRENQLFCSRDRFGIKPFYYFVSPDFFLFASEIKQILQCPGMPRVINEVVAFQYLEQGVQDHTGETFFTGIRQLQGGHSLHIDLSKPPLSMSIEKYWELPLTEGEDNARSEKSYIERFSELFTQSVNRHLRSDVPVGSCLSGGLDSSSIVAIAAMSNRGSQLSSFSSCFELEALDERDFIREIVSSQKLASHFVFPVAEGFWNDLNCLIWHQDEPVGGTSVYAQWCVMRAAQQARVPVLLDGQGGDEILCGYRKFYVFYLWHLLKRANPRLLPEGLAWILRVRSNNLSWTHAKRYVSRPQGRKRSTVARVCSPDFLDRSRNIPAAQIGPGKSLAQRQKEDLVRYSLPALLHYEDRNSMAHSVESRVPMLDHELAEFAVNCPPALKLRKGWTKWILREALRGILPDSVRLRKTKLGFETPQREWLSRDARGTIHSMLQQSELAAGRILSTANVRNEFQNFFARKPGALTDIEMFRVLNLELWCRVFSVS